MGKLLLLFVVVPIVEAILLAKIGDAIGWANTILLVIATGVVGAWLFRLEGGRAWRKWQQALSSGKTPEDGVLGGLLLLLGGAFLITPGVVTDVVGLLLLIPPTRRALASFLRPRIMARFFHGGASASGGGFRVIQFGGPGLGDFAARGRDPGPFRAEVIDEDDVDHGIDDDAARAPDGEVVDAVVVGRRVAVRGERRELPRVIDAEFDVVDRDG
ncbi:MAG: FxsA family protein [Polyangiaceae bacterium]